MLAGLGILLRLQCYRILTLILATLSILWGTAALETYNHLGATYPWNMALIPYGGVQFLYGILAFVILIKKGKEFSESGNTDQGREGRPVYVLAAWASPSVGAVISLVFWLLIVNHHAARGERAPLILVSYILLLLVSGMGLVAAIYSLVGIRSKMIAFSIIPGALIGVCSNGYNSCMCLLALALEGKNMGG